MNDGERERDLDTLAVAVGRKVGLPLGLVVPDVVFVGSRMLLEKASAKFFVLSVSFLAQFFISSQRNSTHLLLHIYFG